MVRLLTAATVAGLMTLALTVNIAPALHAQKLPDTPTVLSARFPSFSFPTTSLVFGKTASVKATFDPGRNGQLVFGATWPQVTLDGEGVYHTRLKIAVRSSTGLRAEAIGFSTNSDKTPKLQITISGTRQQLTGTWYADVTGVDRFAATMSNIQIKAALK